MFKVTLVLVSICDLLVNICPRELENYFSNTSCPFELKKGFLEFSKEI